MLKSQYIFLALLYLLYGVLGTFYYLNLIKLLIFDNINNNIVVLKTD